MRAQQRLSQCEHQHQDGRISIHPSIHIYYIYLSILRDASLTRSLARSPALLFPFFQSSLNARSSKRQTGRSESRSATPEVRPSVPQSRPPTLYSIKPAPSFTDPLRAARRTFRSHGRWKFSTIASLVLQSVLRTCSRRFGPLASADVLRGLVFPSSTESEATFRKTSCVILAAHCYSPLCSQLKLGLGK